MSKVRLALIGPAAFWKKGVGRVPAAVLVVAADRQLEQRRREVVAHFTPVEPRVGHQDHNPVNASVRTLAVDDPVRDPDPAGMTRHSDCRPSSPRTSAMGRSRPIIPAVRCRYYLLATVYGRLGEPELAKKYAELSRTTPNSRLELLIH